MNSKLKEDIDFWLNLDVSEDEVAKNLIWLIDDNDVDEFMSYIPCNIKEVMKELVNNPPMDRDSFQVIESSNYRASFFEGLTEEETIEKMKEVRRQRSGRRFDSIWKIHKFFNKEQ